MQKALKYLKVDQAVYKKDYVSWSRKFILRNSASSTSGNPINPSCQQTIKESINEEKAFDKHLFIKTQ